MSLGVLGQYGSDSSISDSGEEDSVDQSKEVEGEGSIPCVDPLSLGTGDLTETSSDSNSSSCSSPITHPDSSLPSALPLPNIDIIVAKNASYSGSELHASALNATDFSGEEQVDHTKSSVFTNPYQQAETAKLDMLKKHVTEFDKKPTTMGPSQQQPRSKKHHRKSKKPLGEDGGALFDDQDSSLALKKERKHRCGVTDSLEPPKKYMKMYDRVYK